MVSVALSVMFKGTRSSLAAAAAMPRIILGVGNPDWSIRCRFMSSQNSDDHGRANDKSSSSPSTDVVDSKTSKKTTTTTPSLFPMSEFDEGASQGTPTPSDPLGRAARIFKRDIINLSKGRLDVPESEVFPAYVDVAIIGGGIVGSSIAFWLKHRVAQGLNVLVIEKDPSFIRSSTALSVGGLQQQFSLRENIEMAMFAAEFMRNIKSHLTVLDMDPPDIRFTPYGHLFLANESEVDALKESFELQRELGAQVELLTATKIKELYPWVNVDDVELGCCGYGTEGWFDPIRLMKAFQQKAASLGARYLSAEVTGFTFQKVDGIKINDDTERPYERISQIIVKPEDGQKRLVNSPIIVLAAGCDSKDIGRLARIGTYPGILQEEIPVVPRKRYAYAFECAVGPGIDCPHLVDHNGAYFRRDGFGGNFVCGKTPTASEEPDPAHLDVDYSYFENRLLPFLCHRVPSFESLKLTSAWAGLTDYNTFDRAGFLGCHPYYRNLLLATGFDGLGAQQSPAIGRAIMELIVDDNFKTINLERLAFDRVLNAEPIYERNVL